MDHKGNQCQRELQCKAVDQNYYCKNRCKNSISSRPFLVQAILLSQKVLARIVQKYQ